jgi:myo-inositol 2-dehydrogenase / D-chiro-inositol 1-dehydrogenase
VSIRVALLGCGKQAPKHLSGLLANPGVSVVVYDQKAELAKALSKEKNVDWVDNVDAIFDDPSINAIDLCTPVDSHLDYILRGVENGKDFFCEKPLCRTYEEAVIINDAVNKAGRFGMVGFNYRFSPSMLEAQRILETVPQTGDSPVLGKMTHAILRVGGRGGHQLWKHRKESNGGAINEMMVHLIDLALGLFGDITKVDVLDNRLIRNKRMIGGTEYDVDAEDFLLVKLTLANGMTVTAQADLITPSFIHYIDIQGENGNFFGSIQPDMPTYVYCENAAGGFEKGRTDLNFGPRNFFESQMSAFITAIKTGKPPTNGAVSDSVKILHVLDQIRD